MRLLGLFLLISCFCQAQITYEASSYGGIGTELTFSGAALDSVYILPILTNEGEDTNWDFSGLQIVDQFSVEIEDKEDSGYRNGFLLTCILQGGNPFNCNTLWDNEIEYAIPLGGDGFGGQFSDIKIFRKNDNQLVTESILGISVDANGAANQLGFFYTRPDTILEFPLEYEKEFGCASAFDLDFTAFMAPFAFFHKQERTSRVDSWGSLTTPYGTYSSTLRLATRIVYNDTIDLSGMRFSIPREEIVFEWFDVDAKAAVLEIRTEVQIPNQSPSVTSVQFFDSLRCFTPVAIFAPNEDELEIVNGEATFNFNNNSRLSSRYEWDFGDGNTSTDRSPSHTYSSPGSYEVVLTACNTVCDPEICEEFRYTVMVLASTNNEEIFEHFRISNQEGNILIQTEDPNGEITIVNSLGQLISSQKITQKATVIPFQHLSKGLYLIQWTASDGQKYTGKWIQH